MPLHNQCQAINTHKGEKMKLSLENVLHKIAYNFLKQSGEGFNL